MTKTEFILSRPEKESAADVIAAAKEADIQLEAGTVHSIRSAHRRKNGAGKPRGKKKASKKNGHSVNLSAAGRAAASNGRLTGRAMSERSSGSIESEFKALVLRAGTDAAKQWLSSMGV